MRKQSPAALAAGDPSDELARVGGLNTRELRTLWLSMTGRAPSSQLSGDLLRRMVSQYIQERALGGLDRKLATMLDRLADGGGALPARLKIGSVMVRGHGGIMHQIMVVQDGFAWNGQILPSLSAVAKGITGTTWNGNRFFGLRRPGSKEVKSVGPTRAKADPDRIQTRKRAIEADA